MKQYSNLITHIIFVLALGLGAFLGLDANETSHLTQVLTAVATAIVTAVPIVIHVFAHKQNVKSTKGQAQWKKSI